jgi:thiamine-phosphate pyrophosphorylase
LVASDAELAAEVAAAGVHLAGGDPPVEDTGLLVGRSCHDEAEIRAAAEHTIDYVTVSPVAPTASKPGYGPSLGPAGLARLVPVAGDLPVLALGGVTVTTASRWIEAGAHGVAVLGAVMGADDPAAAVAALLDQLPEEDDR